MLCALSHDIPINLLSITYADFVSVPWHSNAMSKVLCLEAYGRRKTMEVQL